MRLPPDLTMLNLTGNTALLSVNDTEFTSSVALSPSYVGGQFLYNATVPFVQKYVRVTMNFAVSGSIGVMMTNASSGANHSWIEEYPVSLVRSSRFPVAVGSDNLLRIDSAADGQK